MNKRFFVFFMTIVIFTNLQAKELEDLLDNYSDTISEKIEDKIKIINENIVNEIDKFEKNFIIPTENNDDDDDSND